jgi:hypothetical protein
MATKKLIRMVNWIYIIAMVMLIGLLMLPGSAFAQTPTPPPGSFEKQLPVGGVRSQIPVIDLTSQAVTNNLVQDPSFEASYNSEFYWVQYSYNFVSPLCTLGDCGNGNGTAGPRTGSVWGWFGGVPGYEGAVLAQNLTIPACASSATLRFYLWIGYAGPGSGANDTFNVLIDSTNVFSVNATQKGSYPTYTLVSINASSFADGAVHTIYFIGETYDQVVTFNIDDVSLVANLTNCTISGNAGATGVTLSYVDGTAKSATSQADGNYSLPASYGWSGVVTPSHACYTFSPTSRTYNNVTTNQTAQNYTATFNPGSGCADIDVSMEELWRGVMVFPPGKACRRATRSTWTGADHKHERFSPHRGDASDLEGDRGADELLRVDGLAGGAVVERVLVPLVQQPGDDRDDPAVPLWERGQHLHDDRGVCG